MSSITPKLVFFFGITHLKPMCIKGLNDEKIQLKNEIKELEQKLGKGNVALASFILSKTPHHKLVDGKLKPPSKKEYIKHNVLFLDDKNWPQTLLEKISEKEMF